MQGHYLDWENQPLTYKDYAKAPTIPLPTDIRPPKGSLWDLAADSRLKEPQAGKLDLHQLATICALTHGFTAQRRMQGQTFFYRNVASAGALYPAELYVATDRIAGIESGIFYYDIREFALKLIRPGKGLGIFSGDGPMVAETRSLATMFISGIFFRSAWKYRARALRYVLLDAGHLLENLRNALVALNIEFRIDYDFNDAAVNRGLGLDPTREAVWVGIKVLGTHADTDRAPAQERTESKPSNTVLTADEHDAGKSILYPEIDAMYRASMVLPEKRAALLADHQVTVRMPDEWVGLPPHDKAESVLSYEQALVQRRSKRNFMDQPIPGPKVLHLLHLLTDAMRSGIDTNAGLQVGFLAGHAEGFNQGFYLLDACAQKYTCIDRGPFTLPMASVCLDQQWLKNAGLHFVFMVNLKSVDQQWGARGYRYAMLEAGRLGQCIYLGATALGLGCCGIGALYDDEARALLSLNTDSALLYLVAVGQVRR
jgi:SagB-type dehydrogenase family enzyme